MMLNFEEKYILYCADLNNCTNKEEVKKRIKRSPDSGDALALTFAEPVYESRRENVQTFGNGNVTLEQLYRDQTRVNYNNW